jgi:hypothetical protein
MTGITDNLREDLGTFMIVFRLIFLRTRNISAKICIQNQNTFDVQLLISENRAVYEIMWKKYCTAGEAAAGNTVYAQ